MLWVQVTVVNLVIVITVNNNENSNEKSNSFTTMKKSAVYLRTEVNI